MTTGRTDISFPAKRLLKEYKQLTKNPTPLVSAEIIDGNLASWIAMIEGPLGTPYEGGKFKLSLRFPPGYPFQPPRVSKGEACF